MRTDVCRECEAFAKQKHGKLFKSKNIAAMLQAVNTFRLPDCIAMPGPCRHPKQQETLQSVSNLAVLLSLHRRGSKSIEQCIPEKKTQMCFRSFFPMLGTTFLGTSCCQHLSLSLSRSLSLSPYPPTYLLLACEPCR